MQYNFYIQKEEVKNSSKFTFLASLYEVIDIIYQYVK
jgi:hypothetical protein